MTDPRRVARRIVALLAIATGVWACESAQAAGLRPEDADSVRAAYQALGSAGVEAKPAAALPEGIAMERIDVSERMRSASFGHTTTLLVPVSNGKVAPHEFWVEYGKSTNQPARLFGP